jgi:hypothetical protein
LVPVNVQTTRRRDFAKLEDLCRLAGPAQLVLARRDRFELFVEPKKQSRRTPSLGQGDPGPAALGILGVGPTLDWR